MLFSYGVSELTDPESPWWVSACTELADKMSAFILLEVYEPCKLWTLSKELIRCINCLDVKVILGDEGDAKECLFFLDVI